ncbi:MAG TPA: hypothetical protein VHK26_03180 [Methyloceanibacter sp.]|jgi:hypothetical protein|nr:hypothetical protein [Methyloceanibacter sp.]
MTLIAPVPGLVFLEGLDSTQRTMQQGALDIAQRHNTESYPQALTNMAAIRRVGRIDNA